MVLSRWGIEEGKGRTITKDGDKDGEARKRERKKDTIGY